MSRSVSSGSALLACSMASLLPAVEWQQIAKGSAEAGTISSMALCYRSGEAWFIRRWSSGITERVAPREGAISSAVAYGTGCLAIIQNRGRYLPAQPQVPIALANGRMSGLHLDGTGAIWSMIEGKASRITAEKGVFTSQYAFQGTVVGTIDAGPVFYGTPAFLVVGTEKQPLPFPFNEAGAYPGGAWALQGTFFWGYDASAGFVKAAIELPQRCTEFSFTCHGKRMFGLGAFPGQGGEVRKRLLTWQPGEGGWTEMPVPSFPASCRAVWYGSGHLVIGGSEGAWTLSY